MGRARDPAKHPRLPRGTERGGEWTYSTAGAGAEATRVGEMARKVMPGGKTAWNGKDEQGRAIYEKIINRAKAAGFYPMAEGHDFPNEYGSTPGRLVNNTQWKHKDGFKLDVRLVFRPGGGERGPEKSTFFVDLRRDKVVFEAAQVAKKAKAGRERRKAKDKESLPAKRIRASRR
jgi:hypothetical protein